MYHVWNLKEDKEDMVELEQRPRIHLARVATTRQERVPVLCDSGATGHIFGEGHMLRQLEDGNLVLFDAQKDGWAHTEELDTKYDSSKEPKHRTWITVTSGASVPGKTVPTVDIGVHGRTMRHDGTWEDEKRIVFLQVNNASASSCIKQTILSEGQFVKENDNLTMIAHGTEKYMVLGKANITFEPVNGVDPIRIDLRPEEGCHYLDVCTAMMDKEKVRSRYAEDNVGLEERRASRAMGRKNFKSSRFLQVNTLTVDNYDGRSSSTVDADTEELEVYFEPVKGRMYVPAHDDQPFETIAEANTNQRHARVNKHAKTDDRDWRMTEARRVLDDQYST